MASAESLLLNLISAKKKCQRSGIEKVFISSIALNRRIAAHLQLKVLMRKYLPSKENSFMSITRIF